jgi:hypothetical protein
LDGKGEKCNEMIKDGKSGVKVVWNKEKDRKFYKKVRK